jgi:transposase
MMEVPTVTVMDSFHVVRLAGDALDRCRRRVQQAIDGHRGRKSAPLCTQPGRPCTPAPTSSPTMAYFERPGTSNGPTEAINGRLEHLRGSALGFRNLTNYIARSLLETGGFGLQLRPRF